MPQSKSKLELLPRIHVNHADEMVVHVWVPALKELATDPNFPTVALRTSATSDEFYLYHSIELPEGSILKPADHPLSGTGGRAVCLVFVPRGEQVCCLRQKGRPIRPFKVREFRDVPPEEIIARVKE
jgi:hypothetical protein